MSFKIKNGIRKNILYPVTFMILANILRIIRIIISYVINNKEIFFFFNLLMVLSSIILGTFFLCKEKKQGKETEQNKIMGIELIYIRQEINKLDNDFKIFVLIFLDAFFELFGCLRHRYFLIFLKKSKLLLYFDINVKSREIIIASLLCYITLGTKLYKHHIVSLIIIIICIIIILILNILFQTIKDYYLGFTSNALILQIIIIICRVFSDIIEKYLFEFNFINPFQLLLFKGIIELFLISFFYFFQCDKEEIVSLFDVGLGKVFLLLFLLAIHSVVFGFLNIYKLFTIKIYSPTTRILFDCLLDVFLFIYYSIIDDNSKTKIFTFYFWIISIFQIIIIFFNLVYNEFLVLYFCGMEKNTYLEIHKRATNKKGIDNIETVGVVDNDESLYIENLNS